MSEILIGISLLLFVACWKFIWQRTLLDYTQDQFFDLQSEVKKWILDNGYSLQNNTYQLLQSSISHNIQHIEKMTILRYLISIYIIKKNSSNNREQHKNKDIFLTNDKHLDDFAKTTFQKILHIKFSYMIFKNIFLCLLFFIPEVFFIIKTYFSMIPKKFFYPQLSPSVTVPVLIGFFFITPLLKCNSTTLEKHERHLYLSLENIKNTHQ